MWCTTRCACVGVTTAYRGTHHRCKEAPLPTAFISHNLTAYLRNASLAGDSINATMTDPDDGSFDCLGRTLKAIGSAS